MKEIKTIVENIIGKDNIKLVEENNTYKILINGKQQTNLITSRGKQTEKKVEFFNLGEAVTECDKVCEPLLIAWHKTNKIKDTT